MVAVLTGSSQTVQSGAPDASKRADQIVSLAAADAACVSGIAVQFHHMVGGETRGLMQIVDVLGDDGGDLAGPVERGKRAVAASRPRRGKGRFHRKAPPPCLIPGIGTGDELIERDRAVAGPQSAGRAEVGNPAFGRNAGAGEGNDGRGLGDHVAELFHAAAKIRCDHGDDPDNGAVLIIARPAGLPSRRPGSSDSARVGRQE
jgi:hypothetical protein